MLHMYHMYHMHHTQGYDKMLAAFSPSIIGALTTLNNLHLHLSLGVPAFVCPDFRVDKVCGGECGGGGGAVMGLGGVW